jgi:regulation of enolase protein 1 (concanavalin A-like superfamily)
MDFPVQLVDDEFLDTLSDDWVWNDPFDDCSFAAHDGLEIRAANGRDLWYLNLSAPRILRAASGDSAVQTVCLPASEKKPAIGGILLWKDDRNFLRLDRGTRGRYEVSFTGCFDNKDIIIGRGRLPSERIFLRMERIGHHINGLCSADGAKWFSVGGMDFPVEDPVEVGLHAIGAIDRTIYHGAYTDGTAIRFESFQLWGKVDEEGKEKRD